MVQESAYDLVVANPPYQGTSKMADAKYVAKHYELAKSNLYAAFLMRGLELVREQQVSAMLTIRDWMFIKQHSRLREHLLEEHDLRALGDFNRGAFEGIPDEVVSVAATCFRRAHHRNQSVAQCPTPLDDRTRDNERTPRKRAATLCQVSCRTFDPAALKVVPEWPLVYWWDRQLLTDYEDLPLIRDVAPTSTAQSTGDNTRFRRSWWEILCDASGRHSPTQRWHCYVGGADGVSWFEPVRLMLNWHLIGLEIKLRKSSQQGRDAYTLASEDRFHQIGITFPKIGSIFNGRVFRVASIFGDAAPAIFPTDVAEALCLMNSEYAKSILSSLNPTVNFGIEDAERLPFRAIECCDEIYSTLCTEFTKHDNLTETATEFRRPGPSPWRHAQEWAQLAVDRAEGSPLPEYDEQLDPEPTTGHLSFAIGVALGRFGAGVEGILDPSRDNLGHALPGGVLFLDGSLGEDGRRDSLGHPATHILHDNWNEHGATIDSRRSLRDWLREKFFADVHKGMYENRPIHWPLSSKKKTFVAWVTIHRWNDQTLRVLLADHLEPALKRLDGEIADLTQARSGADKKQVRSAEQRYDDVKAWRDELAEFIDNVRQCAERGPAPADAKKPEREADARYAPDLDDGVMINSAALWPLLEPQWKDPQKWWKELVAAKGKKDYDWSHLAMRYWPTRVDKKCQADPSLGVAHGCFWKYHPAKAWAWELRLQDEIGPDFRIEEAPYRGDGGDAEHRTAYLKAHPTEALGAVEKEALRRRRKKECAQSELTLREAGLWSSVPEECWQLELKLIEKQKADFRLLAPDEPSARAAYEKKNANKVKARNALLNELKPAKLFSDAVEDDEDETSEIGEEVA
jgi:hypothetical protein